MRECVSHDRGLSPLFKAWIKKSLNGAPVFWRGRSNRNGVAITFDDGPHPEHSPLVLDILRKEAAVATFFVNGNHALDHPDILKRMVDEGHEIGNHTYSHRRLKGLSRAEIADEIGKTREILEKVCGRVRLVRPPWGDIGLSLIFHTLGAGERLVLWTHDSLDSSSKSLSPKALVERMSSLPLRSGDILLFHDDYAHTVRALPAILADLRKRGFGLSRVSELIDGKY
jgi:peptidoglycan-N-acetylglucosamine deacetylase